MKYYYTYSTKFGQFTIQEEDGMLLSICIGKGEGIEKRTPCIERTYTELEEYFLGKRKTLDIPYQLKGTPFQMAVWHCIEKIPYGHVCTYQDIANQIEKPKACQAVGHACHVNPIPFIVPCHRVIGKNSNKVGYAFGCDMKLELLEMERTSL